MEKATMSAALILGITCLIALLGRILFPEIQPVLEASRLLFYLILAVTIIAILRNVFGLITYGVFGPAIISLGLTLIGNVFTGLAILLLSIGIGILVRTILEPLKLQMTHRMAIVLITLAAIIGISKFVGFKLGDDPLSSASFLPILISAWIVERFVRDRGESGWETSGRRLGYTLVAVTISFLLISAQGLVTLFVSTPETWILPVAINILVGSSVRVRLSEYFRFRRLVQKGGGVGPGYSQVLTLNVRNRDYVDEHNPMQLYPTITKLRVKETLSNAGIPTPRTLAVVETYRDLENLEQILDGMPPEGFAIKPNNSFGGRGVSVVGLRTGDIFEKVSGEKLAVDDIRQDMQVAIDGEYSGRWLPDQCMIEERIIADPRMEKLSFSGLPDIRVIVFRGVPVMAMARLPTKASNGKANLHQGAVGAAIDLVSGRIMGAVVAHQNEPINAHPDTGAHLIGEQIPYWKEILELAVAAQKAVGLGYVGVDIVIDWQSGPLVMEVNKRPGLEIQNANGTPLLERLRSVEALLDDGIEQMRILESRKWRITQNQSSSPSESP